MKKNIKISAAFVCLISLLLSFAATGSAGTVYGDADGDGVISAEDARFALRVSVGLEEAGESFERIDVDADKEISSADARLILRFVVGLEAEFPAAYYFESPAEGEMLPVTVKAPRAVFYCVDTNTLLYKKNADARTAPASLLKLLTALTALKYCRPDEVFTVGDEIDLIAWDSSRAHIEKGWTLTFEELMYGMMLPSGNDAAYCVAANVARKLTGETDAAKAVAYFIDRMNETAGKLGMTNTVAKTPDGYDEKGQYTTAEDLLILARAALKEDLIVKVCSCPRYILDNEKILVWETTNHFLRPEKYYYNDHVYGLKGGFTDDAGYCLIAACEVDGQNYIAVVMGLPTFGGRHECVTQFMNAVAA